METGKEELSYVAEDLLDDKSTNVTPKNIRFAHSATAGETSIDLNNLVTPPTMSSNGFTNPTTADIASANLGAVKNILTLKSSRGSLIEDEDFTISGAGTINFLPTSILGTEGALEGEIFEGIIRTVNANGAILADVKEYDFTVDDTQFTPGATLINVGAGYQVNANPNQQTGEVRVYKNGKRIYRNVGNAAADPAADGNYHEVDPGNGIGVMIELNEPAQAGDMFGFDFGLKVSNGSLQVFSELERLQGIIQALASDAAVDFGTNLSDYLVPSATEIERRAFNDAFLKMLYLPVEKPKVIHEVEHIADQSTFLSNGGFYHPNPANFNTVEGGGILQITQSGGVTRFNVLKKARLTFSMTLFVDENTSSGQLTTLVNGASKHRSGSTQDERALSNNVTLTVSPGQEITFGMTLGSIYSVGSISWCRIYAESLVENGTVKDLIGL